MRSREADAEEAARVPTSDTPAQSLLILPAMRFALLGFALALSGCYPTLPTHFAESTEVLAPGNVGITLAGGPAGFYTKLRGNHLTEAAGGFEGRVRVGIGHSQEIGGSVFAGVGTPVSSGDVNVGAGAKLSYKIAPLPWLAAVADAGIMDLDSASVVIPSGDLAIVAAPYTARDGSQVYTGLRGSLGIPILEGARASDEGITIPVGFAFHASPRWRMFVEGGFVAGFGQFAGQSGSTGLNDTATLGGYGVVAVGYVFGR